MFTALTKSLYLAWHNIGVMVTPSYAHIFMFYQNLNSAPQFTGVDLSDARLTRQTARWGPVSPSSECDVQSHIMMDMHTVQYQFALFTDIQIEGCLSISKIL